MKRLDPRAAAALLGLCLLACGLRDERVAGPGTGMETGNTVAGILVLDSTTPAAGIWVRISATAPLSLGSANKMSASMSPWRDSALTGSRGDFRMELPGRVTGALLLEAEYDSIRKIRLPFIKGPANLDLGTLSLQAWMKPGYELTFGDEFEGIGIDTVSRWVPRDYGEIIRNSEKQALVPEALVVRDGRLAITADRRTAGYAGATREYVSGMAITKGRFSQKYGWYEIRCRFPEAAGLHPGLWMLPDTTPQVWPPELLFPTAIGRNPDSIYVSVRSTSATQDFFRQSKLPPPRDGYRVVAVDWSADAIRWYVDGGLMEEYAGPAIPHGPMYLLLNLAVGGTYSRGDPDSDRGFPYALEIDYVRVYRKSP